MAKLDYKQGVYLGDEQITRDAGDYAVTLIKAVVRAMRMTVRMEVHSRQLGSTKTFDFIEGAVADGRSDGTS